MPLATPDLGPFALGPKIGGGGMAAVYLGKYVAPPGEEPPADQAVVALKVIKGDFVKSADHEKMFLDEAQILTRLSHPNVIRTLGYGAQAGAWFIAMELLLGRSLLDVWEAAVEQKRAIPLDLAAHIARQVALGLEHAHTLVDEEDGHKLGLVHRDVNPSNIFVGYDGSVKLIDFGLAKARKRQTRSTRGLIKGKIPYLSPEQIKEDSLDGRSDIYALGTTLWETLTMRRLFKRETDAATIRAIHRGDVPDVRTLVAEFPEPLFRVVERSLRQDRDQRYPTAAAMADDLTGFLGKTSQANLQIKLAAFVEELFPDEAGKQREWLGEATGVAQSTLAPVVPIAEVPAVEVSMPVVAPPALDSETDLAAKDRAPVAADSEPDASAEAESDSVFESDVPPRHSSGSPMPTTAGVMTYALVGALAGIAFVAAWVALR